MKNQSINSFELANAIGWRLDVSRFNDFPEFIQETVRDEMSGSKNLSYYQSRLKGMGFVGLTRVLDAGCGTGQWAAALASINEHADAVDIDENCLRFARFLLESEGLNNTSLQYASINALPYQNNTFDAITCYSVLMLCSARPMDLLREFYRVLKPGGKIYLSVDDFGWYLHLLFDRGRTRTFWKRGIRTIKNIFTNREVKIMLLKKVLTKYLIETGFKVEVITHEGGINLQKDRIHFQSAFPKKYYGFNAILDVLAQKPSDKS